MAMIETDALRWLHTVGGAILLGTGVAITFFMVTAQRTGDVRLIAHMCGAVLLAEMVFTVGAVIAQPLTGTLLVLQSGSPVLEGWTRRALEIYISIGVVWLTALWAQYRMWQMARHARDHRHALPAQYLAYFRLWLAFAIYAVLAVLVILWLMIAKPDL